MKPMTNHGSATAHAEKTHVLETHETSEDDSIGKKVEALTETICGAGNEAAAALLVLMATLQDAQDPKTLAHTSKHLAFTRCGELNVFGMVEAQVAVLESQLLRSC